MKRLALLSIAPIAVFALLIVALSRSAGTAQAEITPRGPTPTPPVGVSGNPGYVPGQTSLGPPSRAPQQPAQLNICSLGAEYHHAGDETLPLANFTMDLPAGDFMVGTITRGQVSTVEVCYRPDASVLKLNDVSGGEVARTARSGDAHLAFDAIVASVRPPFNATLGVRVPTLTTIAP